MTFNEFELSAPMVSRLDTLELTKPIPIQEQAIPPALQGHAILGIAQTGTGKTAAFGIPLVAAGTKRLDPTAPRSARGRVLAQTRELAGQIVQSIQGLTADLRITLVVGGKWVNAQAERLAGGTDILVATPGWLIDLMDRRAIDLGQTRFLVLDEADQMLNTGFIKTLRRIASMLNPDRQTMIFSATMPKAIRELSRHYFDKPIRVEVSPLGKVADKVSHLVHFVPKEQKQALLIGLLDGHREDRALIFSRTKHGAERLMKHLERLGFAATSIHGNKSQSQRDRAIVAFKAGSVGVLVATDVAARGLDIPGVEYIYNYDLPNVPENNFHCIGRAARAGREGRAIAFCAEDEIAELMAIEEVRGTSGKIAGGRSWKTENGTPKPRQERRPRQEFGGRADRLAA